MDIVYDNADQDVIIGFSQRSYSVREDGGKIQLPVCIISGEIKRLSTVSISIVSGTAMSTFVCMIVLGKSWYTAACHP